MTARTVRYVGGPLDGQTLDADGWTDDQLRTDTYEIVDGWGVREDGSQALAPCQICIKCDPKHTCDREQSLHDF